ncbi:MAG: hypothetical protein RL391_56 [Actinomycetota bacterium]
MILWFVGTSVLSVWYVFHDGRFDNRFLILGVLLPDAVDAVWGGARGLHSLVGSVVVLTSVMLATIGRRAVRRRLLALPIGVFLHLVFDGAFTDTGVFWWPFTGMSFDAARLPISERGGLNAVFEAIGLVLCVHAWRIFGLKDPARRRAFLRSGSLSR